MKKLKILFEGHDLKFLTHVIDHFSAKNSVSVEIFTYPGHVIKDTSLIYKALPGFDIVFCEWGLGNLKWFSANKLPGQKLITRIHLQEFSTTYLNETEWEKVDRAIFVGPFMMDKFIRLFPGLQSKCTVISNLIDTRSYNLKKEPDAMYHLGLLGILPKRKSPHLGLEILQELRKTDNRFKLFIKGKRPEEVDWLWRKPEEQEYYTRFYESIKTMGLEEAVIMDPHGADVQQWFQKIGFILSTSEFESFHMAVAEGMASASVPIIRNWEGAGALYPEKYFFKTVRDAVAIIQKYSNRGLFEEEGKFGKKYCQGHFSLEKLLPEYETIMTNETDVCQIREAYQKQKETSESLTAGLVSLKKEKERLHEQFEGVIKQQQILTGNNTLLIHEVDRIKQELSSHLETVDTLKDELHGMKTNEAVIRKELSLLKEDKSGLLNKLQGHKNDIKILQEGLVGQKNENALLRKDFLGQKHENENLNTALAEQKHENENLRTALAEQKLSFALLKEQVAVKIAENGNLTNLVVSLKKENAVSLQSLEEKRKENILLGDNSEREQQRLRNQIGLLKSENVKIRGQLTAVYNSISWKVGSALIKKPMDFLTRKREKQGSGK